MCRFQIRSQGLYESTATRALYEFGHETSIGDVENSSSGSYPKLSEEEFLIFQKFFLFLSVFFEEMVCSDSRRKNHNISHMKGGMVTNTRGLGIRNQQLMKKKSIVLNENIHGIKMIRTDFVKRSKVSVVFPSGYVIHSYRFNNIPDTFDSPYISWANLDCCNGWTYDEEYLKRSVYEGKKLYAGIYEAYSSEMLPSVPGILAGKEIDPNNPHSNSFVCREGCLADYYDLNAVFEHYKKLGIVLSPASQYKIKNICAYRICDFANRETAPYNYGYSFDAVQLICTGLLLGYPLESTASLIEENHGRFQ